MRKGGPEPCMVMMSPPPSEHPDTVGPGSDIAQPDTAVRVGFGSGPPTAAPGTAAVPPAPAPAGSPDR